MTRNLELSEEDFTKLQRLLDAAGNKLREIEGDEDAISLADGCDHWLEIVEALPR